MYCSDHRAKGAKGGCWCCLLLWTVQRINASIWELKKSNRSIGCTLIKPIEYSRSIGMVILGVRFLDFWVSAAVGFDSFEFSIFE